MMIVHMRGLGTGPPTRDSRPMCVVALAWRVHPNWPLILIGNRDEFHARPAAPLAAWDDDSGIIAGRDLQAGGTWLGAHPHSGRIVVVTNVRGTTPDPAKESRGALVVDMLRGDGRFANPVKSDLDRFNAFNLFVIGNDGVRLMTNRPGPQITALERGVHALANETVDRPCPRAARLGTALQTGADPQSLLDALTLENDPALFLRGDVYGTRASTLVAVAADGSTQMIERRYEAGGRPIGTTALQFSFG